VLPEGAFIWTNFPFGQPPEMRSQPGPSPHIAYHLGSDSAVVLLAYTSSGPWRGSALGTPPGIVEFDEGEANLVGQRAFHIDLRTLARAVLTPAWFPHLEQPGRGIVGITGEKARKRILQAARSLAAVSPEIIETRGIGSQVTTVARRPTRPT
jgi:hypothetical protein